MGVGGVGGGREGGAGAADAGGDQGGGGTGGGGRGRGGAGEDGGVDGDDSVSGLLRQILGQNPELRSTLYLLERYNLS